MFFFHTAYVFFRQMAISYRRSLGLLSESMLYLVYLNLLGQIVQYYLAKRQCLAFEIYFYGSIRLFVSNPLPNLISDLFSL